jgi:pro-sigmaK processing inhibitor BofA
MDLLSLLAAVIIILLIVGLLFTVLRTGVRVVRYLVVNAILGLIILGLANLVGIHVPINWITILFSAIAGIPGAIIMIILFLIGVI